MNRKGQLRPFLGGDSKTVCVVYLHNDRPRPKPSSCEYAARRERSVASASAARRASPTSAPFAQPRWEFEWTETCEKMGPKGPNPGKIPELGAGMARPGMKKEVGGHFGQ